MMQYKGITLRKFLKNKKYISLKLCNSITSQYFLIKKILNKYGLIHIDLHTKNITINKTNLKYLHAKINGKVIKIKTYGYLLSFIDYGAIWEKKNLNYIFFREIRSFFLECSLLLTVQMHNVKNKKKIYFIIFLIIALIIALTVLHLIYKFVKKNIYINI